MLKQEELARKAGVGIHFLRDLEQGKESQKMEKLNQLLRYFGYCLSPVPEKMACPYSILSEALEKKIKIYLRKNGSISGTLVGFQTKNDHIIRFKIVADDYLKEYKSTHHPSLVQFVEHIDIETWQLETTGRPESEILVQFTHSVVDQ
jgi:hypothetical protein